MPRTNIIRLVERSLNDKFPDNIGKILIEAGFTTKTSISKLSDPSNIKIIEQHVNENPEKYRNILKNTKYENLVKFKFLPGHEAILKAIPGEIVKINEKKEQKKVQKRRHSETAPVNPQIDSGRSDLENDVNEIADIETSKKIKHDLINKIKNFGSKKQIPVGELSKANLLNFRCEDTVFKCKVQCPHCEKSVPCHRKKAYWLCGNFTAHLKTHHIEHYEVHEDHTVSKITKRPHAKLNIIKITKPNDTELNDILNTGAFT